MYIRFGLIHTFWEVLTRNWLIEWSWFTLSCSYWVSYDNIGEVLSDLHKIIRMHESKYHSPLSSSFSLQLQPFWLFDMSIFTTFFVMTLLFAPRTGYRSSSWPLLSWLSKNGISQRSIHLNGHIGRQGPEEDIKHNWRTRLKQKIERDQNKLQI